VNDSNLNLLAQIELALRESGPQSGSALSERFPDVHPIGLWKLCYGSKSVLIQNCARYYLRYDVTRENMLRLSPSILRDFLTFSLIYLPEQGVQSVEAGTRLANRFRRISLRKLSLAREALLRLPEDLQKELNENCVVFLSGDIAYYLAHDTLRQHDTLNVPIKGSDIDIVIINNLESDPEKVARIEAELLKIKRQYLITPDILYQSLMRHLDVSGARTKIEADFEVALGERKQTIGKIMNLSLTQSEQDSNVHSLFYASQERLEFS